MLHLQCETGDRWLRQVDENLPEILVDHAHCEKKAARTALNLIVAYVEQPQMCRELTEIVVEELEHFIMVLDLLDRREIRFRRLKPSIYGRELHKLIRHQEPGMAIDRMLVAALIEARSCERFSVLDRHLKTHDPELATFFGGLYESEARHYSTYIRFATEFGSEPVVMQRLDELAAEEARIIEQGDILPRVHS